MPPRPSDRGGSGGRWGAGAKPPRRAMSAGDLLLVVGAVLCALAFAALAVTLVRVRDTLGSLRAEVAELRAEATPLLADLRASADEAGAAVAAARADLERFDRVLGSAEAISATA